jgi:hypothetical protein
MMGYRSEEKVDESGLYLSTHYAISLGMMCSFRKQTSSDAKINLHLGDIQYPSYKVSYIDKINYVTIFVSYSYYL